MIYRHSATVRVTHWVNALVLLVLLMSGMQIFNAHPALYLGAKSQFDDPIMAMGTVDDDGTPKGVTTIFGYVIPTHGVFGLSGDADSGYEERGFPWWLWDMTFGMYQEHGVDYLVALMTGYEDKPPAGVTLPPATFYNKYYPGHGIAMPPPLTDKRVEYTDGSPTTVEQYAKDISAFLMWTAEPTLEARKRIGIQVMIFLIVLSLLRHALGTPFTARIGVTDWLEARVGTDGILMQSDGVTHVTGIGGTQIGAKLRLWTDPGGAPVLSILPTVNLPTASVEKGFGSGSADVTVAMLTGTDFLGRSHVDINYGIGSIGGSDGTRHFAQHLVSVSASAVVFRRNWPIGLLPAASEYRRLRNANREPANPRSAVAPV